MSELFTVRPGDGVSAIAYRFGLYWKQVWDHPENAELHSSRDDPEILVPGDRVFIPDKVLGECEASANQRHRFRQKGVPAVFCIRVWRDLPPDKEKITDKLLGGYYSDNAEIDSGAIEEDDGEPYLSGKSGRDKDPPKTEAWAGVSCRLEIDGIARMLTTDGDGLIKTTIKPDAKEGLLTVAPDTEDQMQFKLALGHLQPVDQVIGAQQRLQNLGLLAGQLNGEEGAGFEQALKRFQFRYGLKESGEFDEQTQQKLKEAHGA